MLPIPELRRQIVRDLAYSCFSPNLIDAFELITKQPDNVQCCHIELTSQRRDWLQALDANSAPLETHLAQLTSRRLGLYFETLWHFFLTQDPQLELIASNVPVRNATKTLGEFDVIYRDLSLQRDIHLELAIKFYLGDNKQLHSLMPGNLHHWLGRGANDRFDRKLQRLLHHQIALSSTTAGQEVLHKLRKSDKPVDREIALKGRLFYPLTGDYSDYLLTDKHLRGRWLTLHDFSRAMLPALTEVEFWCVLDKQQWISPALREDHKELLTKSEVEKILRGNLKVNKRPVVICALERKKNVFIETTRYFITDADWPGSMLSSTD